MVSRIEMTDLEKLIFPEEGTSYDAKAFGLELKKYRLRQGLTQRQLGEKWGLSRYTIIRAETGTNISWESAYRLFAKLTYSMRDEIHDNN
jgi:DNA-binding XRE family transcriptional regulator